MVGGPLAPRPVLLHLETSRAVRACVRACVLACVLACVRV